MKIGYLSLALLALPVHAADQAIAVTATRDPEWKSYRAFVAGMDAFQSSRTLAPAASLKFILRPYGRAELPADITLRIRGDTVSIPVAIAADRTFVIERHQAASDDDADMVLNQKKGAVRWRPDIRSDGVPPAMRRLGDLRLECAVRGAIEHNEMPMFAQKVLRALNDPCRSQLVRVAYY
ncbi:MAG TPA: hypothetical protein VIT92_06365, partial [Burkholderiaceae bacterium]